MRFRILRFVLIVSFVAFGFTAPPVFGGLTEENLEASGDDVPDVWTAGEELTNAAGELRTAAAALRFHLVRDLL